MDQKPASPPPENPPASARRRRQPTTASEFIAGDITSSNVAIGDGASVIVNQALSNAQQARLQEDYEREQLAQALAEHARNLIEQVDLPAPQGRNPYKYLSPFSLGEAGRFYGRKGTLDALLDRLTCQDSSCRLVVLHGRTGIGKTSLLQAGVLPALLACQHLPLLVRVTGLPLVRAIKESLPLSASGTSHLQQASLQEYLRKSADLLPRGKHVFVLLDQFEVFFDQPLEMRQEFAEQMAQCLFDSEPRDHWLICIRSSYIGHLHALAPVIPTAAIENQVALPLLSRGEASAAALEPARSAGIEFENALLEDILDDLGGDLIDPARLQLVLNTLAQGLKPGENRLSRAAYQELGGEAGISRDHLELALQRNFQPELREQAWQVLDLLARRPDRAAKAELEWGMAAYGLQPPMTDRLLDALENQRLLIEHDQSYELAADSLRSPVEEWVRKQAASQQTRAEVARQWQRVRGSSLRGLFGGAAAICLAYLIAYWFQTFDRRLLPINMIYEALPGSIAGLLLILSVDIAVASYHGPQRWMRWLVGAIGGAIAFGQALLFHTALNVVFDPIALLRAGLQGLLWGALVGLGTIWVLSAERLKWLRLAVVSVASGLAFWLLDRFGGAFQRPRLQVSGENLDWLLILAGAVIPLLVIAAALLGRQSQPQPD